jgi:hypothetical protein
MEILDPDPEPAPRDSDIFIVGDVGRFHFSYLAVTTSRPFG